MHKKFDPKVFQLGYVALATPDLARAKDHYLDTIGLVLEPTVLVEKSTFRSDTSIIISCSAGPIENHCCT